MLKRIVLALLAAVAGVPSLASASTFQLVSADQAYSFGQSGITTAYCPGVLTLPEADIPSRVDQYGYLARSLVLSHKVAKLAHLKE